MSRTARVTVFAFIAVILTGCSISQTVDPLTSAKVGKVCVLDNPKVLMDEFQPEIERQLQGMGFQTRTYTGQRPPECSHHMEYTANWQWDMAMYLTYAEFRIYDAQAIAATATYDARLAGVRLDKFGPTAEKIRPLLTQLFAAVETGAILPVSEAPSAGDSALVAPGYTREARLKELLRLKEQALITDEEYDSKRQAILEEI